MRLARLIRRRTGLPYREAFVIARHGCCDTLDSGRAGAERIRAFALSGAETCPLRFEEVGMEPHYFTITGPRGVLRSDEPGLSALALY